MYNKNHNLPVIMVNPRFVISICWSFIFSRAPHRYLDQKINKAEVAFTVRDPWQNRGVGTHLMNLLITIAKRNGISGFTAEVLRENKAMQRVFHKSDCQVKSRLNEGIYSFELAFSTGTFSSL